MSTINDANFKPLSEGVTLYPGQRVIKIGNMMFPVGIGNNAMPAKGGMDFYKCAAVYGPRKVKCYIISGCPTAAVNGTYMPTEFTTVDGGGNKQTVYSNGTYYYYYNSTDMIWCISGDYNSYNWMYYGEGSYWSDSNWDGVSGMTGVESTAIVDADALKTWDGYKAVLTNGIYEFEKTLTTGLTYGEAFTPVRGRIFDAKCTIKVEAVWTSIPLDGLIFYDPLDGGTPDAPIIGGNYTSGSLSYTVIDGIACADITEGQQLIKNDISNYPANNITLSCWARKKGDSGFQNLFGYGIDSTFRACMLRGNKDSGVFGVERASGQIYSDVNIMDGKWHHLAATIGSNGNNTLWVDGVAVHSFSDQFNIDGSGSLAVGGWVNGGYSGDSYLAACRLYSRVLTDAEIADLANEFSI